MSLQKPNKCISIEEAKELEKNWCDTRQGAIDKCMTFEDSREFWWSLEELQEYLNYVREESNKQRIVNPGIRVYLGAYSKKKCKDGKGYSTIFLSATGTPRESFIDRGLPDLQNNERIAAYNGSHSGRPPSGLI